MRWRIDNLAKIDMKKPNVRGPSPGRKAHLALRERLNRKSKPAPEWPAPTEGWKKSRQNVRRSVYGKD
ncbi:MAG: hypothetical protein DMF45_00995 [Verrucomicrobia bacterium]|nr:MAG: hypothetical protein DMF45_00995 [Verrucomicrobiota bacterium]